MTATSQCPQKVLLSQAKLKFDSDTPTNAYIYMSSNSNHSSGAIACDIGLIGAPANNGGWYLIASRNNNNSNTTSSAGMKTLLTVPPNCAVNISKRRIQTEA